MVDKREQCKSCKIGCSENIFQIKLNQSRIPFDKCFDYVPKQTNADKIRSMDDAELAGFLRKTIWNEGSDLFDCYEIGCDNVCWKCDMYLKWLQSEAE